MIRLLQKYQQWLLCFFSSLLLVVFSSVVFAQEAPTSNVPSVDVANAPKLNLDANYNFAASHSEPNFYN